MKRSTVFERALKKGQKLLRNPYKALNVIKQAGQKSEEAGEDAALNKKVPGWKNKIHTLGRMVKAYLAGNYTKIPKRVIVQALATLIYFVWVIDAIPDFILVVGFVDDATVLAWLLSSINTELEAFQKWEAAYHREAKPG